MALLCACVYMLIYNCTQTIYTCICMHIYDPMCNRLINKKSSFRCRNSYYSRNSNPHTCFSNTSPRNIPTPFVVTPRHPYPIHLSPRAYPALRALIVCVSLKLGYFLACVPHDSSSDLESLSRRACSRQHPRRVA